MKLAAVSPWSSPFTYQAFTKNIAQMIAAFRRPGWEIDYFMGRGCDPAARHVDCCLQALDWGADLICFTGPDQVHPVDMYDRLVDRWEQTNGRGVITALVPFRGYRGDQDMEPFQPMGWRLECEGIRECRGMAKDPDMFKSVRREDGEFQQLDIIGSGVLMFAAEHLRALKKPWFYYKVDVETMQRVADMDTRFVWRLKTEAGAEIWVDTTIMVRHLHIFQIDDTFSDRFKDWKDAPDPEGVRYEHPGTSLQDLKRA